MHQEAEIKNAKLVSIGELSTQILHDVMTPLMVIESCEKTLRRKSKNGITVDQAEEISGKISKNIDAIKGIFNEMRSLMRGDNKMRDVEVSEIIDESVTLLEGQAKVLGVKIINGIPNELKVKGNRSLLTQVFSNLIKNSIEATSTLPEKWVKITANNADKYVHIKVVDSGMGIPPNIRDHIFDSFFTTKSESGGTGIGLGSCLTIIQAHKGELSINNDSHNTEFDIRLPVYQT